jgi:hypothetical protein
MGGKAIKQAHGIETVRLEARDYHRVSYCARLEHPGVRSAVIPAYKNKPDFGDADILYCGDLPENYLTSSFPINVPNGNVLSVAWPLNSHEGVKSFFQVDYIRVKPEEFDFALGYFSYNDLGNLIGRVAHRMGLKFGHDGLWAVLRKGDYVVSSVLVTQDFNLALSILGYGSVPQLDDLEDIFNYVTTSRYFSKDLFPLEHRNTKARMRDRKRATYTAFLQWLSTTQPPDGELAIPRNESVARADPSLATFQRISSMVPGFASRLSDARRQYAVKLLEHDLFNGEFVAELVPYTGNRLGRFIAYFKNYIGLQLFSYWVLTTTESEKTLAIKTAYVNYNPEESSTS